MEHNVLQSVDLRALGQELQKARISRGLTQEQAASAIDVARTTIVAIEKGERRVRADELIKLAEIYGRQISDLLPLRPQINPFQPRFRAYHQLSEADRDSIEPYVNELEELARNYVELEQLVKSPLVQRHHEHDISNLSPEQAAQGVAQEERNQLGLGDGPVPFLRSVLEQDVGLRIFYLPLPHKFSGFYCYDRQVGGCIAVNSHHPAERRLWTLAHEYAEFLVDRNNVDILVENGYTRRPAKERFADEFARHFLMPASGLTRRFNDVRRTRGTITPADLITLAHYYAVSFEALTRHLEDLRLLPTGTWDKLRHGKFKVREAQQLLGLNQDSEDDSRLPTRYTDLATIALDHELITEGHYARLLGVDRIEARRIARHTRQRIAGLSDGLRNLDLTQSIGS
ncbi:MAG: XRE family transcriptional regulator [Anaerolineae bacterium]